MHLKLTRKISIDVTCQNLGHVWKAKGQVTSPIRVFVLQFFAVTKLFSACGGFVPCVLMYAVHNCSGCGIGMPGGVWKLGRSGGGCNRANINTGRQTDPCYQSADSTGEAKVIDRRVAA